VRVFWDGTQQVQQIRGGGGFCSQNQRRLHFGLGKNPRLQKVEIKWPSGKTQVVEQPSLGQTYRIKEAG
jgi:hypothetical protein